MISKFQRSLGWNVWVSHMYNGAKLFNMLPLQMRGNQNPDTFKNMSKDWIWKNIPSYILIIFFIAVKVLWIKKQIYNTIQFHSFKNSFLPLWWFPEIPSNFGVPFCKLWRLNSRVNTNDIFTETCHKEFHRENYFNKFKSKFISRLFSVYLCFGTEKHARSSIIKILWIGVGMLRSKEKTLECLKVYSK